MLLQIAINILYDRIMQCLHCLRNVHDRITLLVVDRVLATERFTYFWLSLSVNIFL